MPKPTFLNLAADKRARIVELALDEFAAQPYHLASLSRIVDRAGIAKGSVYQYFDNKLDLYRWLLTEEVPRRKRAAQRKAVAEAGSPTDLRAWLRALVLAGIDQLVADPRLVGIIAPIVQPTEDPELRALYGELRTTSHAAFVALLAPMQARGEIRADADLELVARIIGMVLGQGVSELVLARLGLRVEQLAALTPRARARHRTAIARVVDEALELLLGGLSPRARGA